MNCTPSPRGGQFYQFLMCEEEGVGRYHTMQFSGTMLRTNLRQMFTTPFLISVYLLSTFLQRWSGQSLDIGVDIGEVLFAMGEKFKLGIRNLDGKVTTDPQGQLGSH